MSSSNKSPALGRWRRPASLTLTASLALGGLSLGLQAVPASADTKSPSAKTLTVPMSDSGVDTLNPFQSYYDGALNAFGIIYPTLNTLGKDGVPGPYLANSWTTSDDKLTWTFKLQDGLKWTDGKPITAEDVAWTFNLIMTNPTAATANGSLVENFESVTAPDATTVVIKTKQPQSNMLYVSIPVSGIHIVPKHIWEAHVADIGKWKNDTYPIVGYGPWTLQTYKTDQYEKFSVNKNFKLGSHGPPKFDNLIIKLLKNSDAGVAALKSGQLASAVVNAQQFNALKGDKSLLAVQSDGARWTAIEVNAGAKTRTGKKIGTANPALADDQVRLAIHWAIDKDKLVTNVLGGQGVAGLGYLPPAWPQWKWSPAPADKVSFDLAKANSILDDAGYKKGSDGVRTDPNTGKKLELRLGIHSDDTNDAQVSKFMKGWLRDIGISLKIESQSFAKLNSNLAKGDWDMLMDGWGTGPDPTYLLSIQTCGTLPDDKGENGNTDAFHCNPAYDALFTKQIADLNAKDRVATVAQMQDILYKANSDIILYYADGLEVARNDKAENLYYGKPSAGGRYPAQSVFWSYLDAAPPGTTKASDSSNTGLYVGLAALAAVVVGGVVFLRRRSGSDVRE